MGVSTFQDPIQAVAIAGGAIYILLSASFAGKSILRVSIHYSYMPVEMTLRKPLPISTSTTSSPLGSMENLLNDADQGGEGKSDAKEKKEEVDDKSSQVEIEESSSKINQDKGVILPVESDKISPSLQLPEKEDTDGDTTAIGSTPVEAVADIVAEKSGVGQAGESQVHSLHQDKSRDAGQSAADSGDGGATRGNDQDSGLTNSLDIKSINDHPSINNQTTSPRIYVTTSASPEPRMLHDGNVDDGILVLEPTSYYRFEKSDSSIGGNERSSDYPRAAQEEGDAVQEISTSSMTVSSDQSPSINAGLASTGEIDASNSTKSAVAKKVPLSDNEKSRRQRMAQACDDDDIVADKHKKKKRKTKGKKLSSATSELLAWQWYFRI